MKQKYHKLFRTVSPLFLFLLISFLLILKSNGFSFTGIINGGDTDWFVYPILELKDSLAAIKFDSFGIHEYFPFVRAIFALPAWLIYLVTRSPGFTNWIYFIFLFALPGYSMYLLSSSLDHKWYSKWIAALFYMLNPFVYFRFHTPMIHIQCAYFMLPLLVLLFIHIVGDKKNFKYIVLYAFGFVSIFSTFNLFAVYMVLVPAVSLILMKQHDIKIEISKRQLITFGLIMILFNAVSFATLSTSILNYQSDYSDLALVEAYRDENTMISSNYNMLSTFGGYGTYAWNYNLYDEQPGVQAYSILGSASKSLLIIVGAALPFFAILLSIGKKRWTFIPFIPVLVFLMTGFGAPLGGLYEGLFSRIPIYLDIFRDSWGYWGMVYMFILSLMVGVGLTENSRSNKLAYGIIFGAFYAISIILFFINPGSLINRSWFVKIPQSYYEVANRLTNEYKEESVLALPLTDHSFGYTYYNWGYGGPDVLSKMADVRFIDKYLYSIATYDYIENLDKLSEPNEETLLEFVQSSGVEAIVLRKDLVKESDQENMSKWVDILNDGSCFTEQLNTDELVVYDVECSTETGLAVQSSVCTIGNITSIDGALVDSGSASKTFFPLCSDIYSLSLEKAEPYIFQSSLRYLLETNGTERFFPQNDTELSIKINDLPVEDKELYLTGEKIVYIDVSDLVMYRDPTFIDTGSSDNLVQTCSKEDNCTIKSVVSSSGIRTVSSLGQQICFYKKIAKDTESGSTILMSLKYKSEDPVDISYCLLSRIIGKCVREGSFTETEIWDYRERTRKYQKEVAGWTESYVMISGIEQYSRGDLTLYTYMDRGNNLPYQVFLDSIVTVQIPESLSSVRLFEKNVKNDITNVRFTGTRGFYKISDFDAKNIVMLRQLYGESWLIFGVQSGKLLPEVISEENHAKCLGMFNCWYISDNYDSLFVIYLPQLLYWTGLIVSFWGIVVFAYVNKRSKKKSQ